MSTGLRIEAVVPASIDDPARPSGGNRYGRRLLDELTRLGWSVGEHRVAGGWPWPAAADLTRLGSVVSGLAEGALVLVDGLIGSAAAEVLVPAATRLRVVVLVHMPLAEADPSPAVRASERAVLSAATAVVTTSAWTQAWLVGEVGTDAARVHVARPGVEPAPLSPGSPGGRRLLCLAAVTVAKGHDVLLSALGEVADLDWRLTCAGALDLEPAFVADLREQAQRAGIGDRVDFCGPLAGDQLAAALERTDLLVSASRRESYGMAVTEALARGIPVVVTDVGGHAEAVGPAAAGGGLAGRLVPPDDPDRLAGELRRWLVDPAHRASLRAAAAGRRTTLGGWDATAARVAAVLADAIRPAGVGR